MTNILNLNLEKGIEKAESIYPNTFNSSTYTCVIWKLNLNNVRSGWKRFADCDFEKLHAINETTWWILT